MAHIIWDICETAGWDKRGSFRNFFGILSSQGNIMSTGMRWDWDTNSKKIWDGTDVMSTVNANTVQRKTLRVHYLPFPK